MTQPFSWDHGTEAVHEAQTQQSRELVQGVVWTG